MQGDYSVLLTALLFHGHTWVTHFLLVIPCSVTTSHVTYCLGSVAWYSIKCFSSELTNTRKEKKIWMQRKQRKLRDTGGDGRGKEEGEGKSREEGEEERPEKGRWQKRQERRKSVRLVLCLNYTFFNQRSTAVLPVHIYPLSDYPSGLPPYFSGQLLYRMGASSPRSRLK